MTRKEAIQIMDELANIMLTPQMDEVFTAEQKAKIAEAKQVMLEMKDTLSRNRDTEAEKEKRKAKRAEEVTPIIPVIVSAITKGESLTAKEIFERTKTSLPTDWTPNKVQYLLLNDIADKVGKNEVKGKPNTYYLL